MRNLRRFEGTDPAEVRAQVLEELGPAAQIVRAGRERSGGLLGFFEKEVFVIEVEPPADLETTPRRRRERASAAPAPQRRPVPEATASPLRPAAAPGVHATAERPRSAAERLAEQTDDVVELAPAGAPVAAGARARRGAPAPAPTGSSPVARAHSDDYPSDDPLPAGFAALLEEAEEALHTGLDDPIAPPPPARRVGPPTSPAPSPRPAPPASPSAGAPAGAQFVRLGLPKPLCPVLGSRATTRDLGDALVAALHELPAVPDLPTGGDAVIVTAGPGDESVQAAAVIAKALGIGDDAIVLLGSRSPAGMPTVTLCRSAIRAATAVAERRIAGRPTVLAVVATGSPSGRILGDVVRATRPEQIWLALPADAPQQVVARLRRQAGAVDALALSGLDDAARPAELLELNIPVGYLDGRRASAYLWAAHLLEHPVPADVPEEVGADA